MRHPVGNATVTTSRAEVTALMCCGTTRRAINGAAHRYVGLTSDTREDMVQVGTIGVLEALATEGFDPDALNFSRFAYWRAREAIGKHVQAMNRMKRHADLTLWRDVHSHPRDRTPLQQLEMREEMQRLVNASGGRGEVVAEMCATYHLVVDPVEAAKVTDALVKHDRRKAEHRSPKYASANRARAGEVYVSWTNH